MCLQSKGGKKHAGKTYAVIQHINKTLNKVLLAFGRQNNYLLLGFTDGFREGVSKNEWA